MGDLNVKKIGYIIVAVIVVLGAIYWYGSRDTAGGTGTFTDNISAIGVQQQGAIGDIREVKDGLGVGAAEAERLAAGIGQAADRVEEVEHSLANSEREVDESRRLATDNSILLREAQQILSTVQRRDAEKAKPP